MPGMYSTEEYDLAGFTVGIVDKKKIVTGEKIEAGHVLIEHLAVFIAMVTL